MIIESRQIIFDYQDASNNISFKNENGVEDYMALKADVATLINLINNGEYEPQFGTGSPEGVVTSNSNRTYYDTTLAPASVIMYTNQTVGVKTGWIGV